MSVVLIKTKQKAHYFIISCN